MIHASCQICNIPIFPRIFSIVCNTCRETLTPKILSSSDSIKCFYKITPSNSRLFHAWKNQPNRKLTRLLVPENFVRQNIQVDKSNSILIALPSRAAGILARYLGSILNIESHTGFEVSEPLKQKNLPRFERQTRKKWIK